MGRSEDLELENAQLKAELEALKRKYSFMWTALENLPNPIFMKDENAQFTFFNQRYAEAFGMRRREYIGKSVLDLDYLPEEDRKRYQEEDVDLIRSSETLSYIKDFDLSDGKTHPSLYWSKGIYDETYDARGLVGEIVDISKERKLQVSLDRTVEKLRKTNLKLEKMAEIDAGTGIYNRTLLSKKAKDLTSGKKKEMVTCALMADLDYFKRVNDLYGHVKGDEVLSQFAAILSTECRDDDIPIRYGGEEFLLLLENATLQTGIAVAERIRKRCEKEVALPDGDPITVSIGVATFAKELNLVENIAKVDHQLYLAKERGRNCVVCNGVTAAKDE